MASVSLFDSLYDNAKDVLKRIKRPIVQRQLQRKYQSAYDDLLTKIDAKKGELLNFRADFENYDLNKVFAIKEEIKLYERAIDALKEDFLEMFNKPFAIVE
jgi:hypothetical protein